MLQAVPKLGFTRVAGGGAQILTLSFRDQKPPDA